MGNSYQIHDQYGLYFLTFQIVGWVDVFSRKDYRDLVIDSLQFCRKHKQLDIYAYVIMSNHLHLIAQSKSGQLSNTIRDFKRFTANNILKSIHSNNRESRRDWMDVVFRYHAKYNKRAKEKQFWTHENHAVELSNNRMIDSRVNYIHQNPVRAGIVELPEEYIYSSAKNYCGLPAILDIDLI